jgi:4-hydroxy-2-oxoheptanedioate aldolase
MTPIFGMAACVFRSVEILSVARHAGFDFLLADMEHGAMSLGEAATLCVAGLEADYPVRVRVPGPRSEFLSRVADCGARGIVVPHVSHEDDARHVVERLRFAPVGRRSIPSPIAATGFRPVPGAEFAERCATSTEVAVMIESAEALARVEAIAAVEGVDTVMIGTNDLASSLGRLGRIDHPEVAAAFERIADAAKSAGRRFGVMGLPEAALETHAYRLGADEIVACNEINLLFEAAADLVARLKCDARSD